MVRTQIYLTQREREGLSAMAKATGKKQSELIRDAVDRLIERASAHRRGEVLRKAAGMWKHRVDLPDFRAIRAAWDRS
jgi:hypothetical protein